LAGIGAMPGKRVAILQSNYIPWKGYFDLINSVDEFILYDDMQFTRRDWRNRNKIKTQTGVKWLTIPEAVKGKYFQKINETQIQEPDWGRRHYETLRANYLKTPYFHEYNSLLTELYLTDSSFYLSEVNHRFLKAICDLLGIRTKISWSSDYELCDGKTERLVSLCQQADGQYYLSGPAAKDYIDTSCFDEAGIELGWMDYTKYPEYPQHFPPFDHAVTILDMLFNVGPDAPKYMKSFA
jgi:hypothetical protein